MKYLATILAAALLALPVAAHHRRGHQEDEYAELRNFPCPLIESLEKDYRWDIILFETIGWGDPVEISKKAMLLRTLLDIKSHVCRDV